MAAYVCLGFDKTSCLILASLLTHLKSSNRMRFRLFSKLKVKTAVKGDVKP